MRGDGLVGEQHELFDQPMRDVALGGDDLLDHPLVVEHDLRLLEVEVDRAAPVTAPVQDLEELVHQLELRHELAISRADGLVVIGEDRVDVRVGHARVAVDHAVVDLVAHDRPLAVDLHQAGLHEPIDVGVQAAETGREVRREHVDRAVRESTPTSRARRPPRRARRLPARSARRRRCGRRASSCRSPGARS